MNNPGLVRSAVGIMLMSIVLAAGAGTRMKSKLPKVLHKVVGVSMVEHVLDVVEHVDCHKKVVVIGHGADEVKKAIDHRDVKFVLQSETLGTGHAVMQAEEEIPEDGNVIVLYGDTPLINEKSIEKFIKFHEDNDFSASVLTTEIDDPTGYGRIIRNEFDKVVAIVEEKDTSVEQKKIKEINSGIYCFKASELKKSLSKLDNNNNQGEYYLTDVIEILNREDKTVGAYIVEDDTEIMGVNSRRQLAQAERIMQDRILGELMDKGVTIIDPNNTYVGKKVKIDIDTVIYPGCFIMGATEIGEDCKIGPNTRIEDSIIKDNVDIKNSTVLQSSIDSNTNVGPYAYLRPNSDIGKNVKTGIGSRVFKDILDKEIFIN